jgi:hypothetical protein
MPTPDELKELFKTAADVASQVPEDLRQVAFQRALDSLIGASPAFPGAGALSQPSVAPTASRLPRPQKSGAVTRLLEVVDRTELAALLAGRKTLDRALFVLQVAQRHDVDALSAADIAQVLTVKFREATTPSAVRMALDRNTEYTDRRPDGGSFLYTLMASGERYLSSVATSAASVPARHSKPKLASKGAKPKTAPPEPPVDAPASRPKPGKTGRPGPKAMLEKLISEGFFTKARAMAPILAHIEEKKTHRYATSDFTATLQRLIRQGKLDRSRNDKGQYEYKAK